MTATTEIATAEEDPRPSPLASERAEVERAEQLVAKWETLEGTKTAELGDLEGRAGELLVADDADAALTDRAAEIATLRDAIAASAKAAAAARQALTSARRAMLRAAARVTRDRAIGLREESDRRQRRTSKLLAELEAHEGVPYTATATGHDATGAVTVPLLTRTEAMRREAQVLDNQAAELDRLATGDITVDVFQKRIARADPDGPEAAARAALADRQRRDADELRARHRAIEQARREWLTARTEQIAAGAPSTYVSPDRPVFAATAREAAENEFQAACKAQPDGLDQHERWSAALAQLDERVAVR